MSDESKTRFVAIEVKGFMDLYRQSPIGVDRAVGVLFKVLDKSFPPSFRVGVVFESRKEYEEFLRNLKIEADQAWPI